MSIQASRKAQQMTGEKIATIAVTGVARALAARKAAGVELDAEELADVQGGFMPIRPYRRERAISPNKLYLLIIQRLASIFVDGYWHRADFPLQ